MSNKELDNLFKSKLGDLERQPTSSAWSKIQEETQPVKASWPWMRVAAAVLLLLVAGTSTWYIMQSPAQEEVLSKNKAAEEQKSAQESVQKDTPTEEFVAKNTTEDNSEENIEKTQELTPGEPEIAKSVEGNQSQTDKKLIKQQREKTTEDASKSKEEVTPTLENLGTEENYASNETPNATIEEVTASDNQNGEAKGTTIELNIEQFSKTKEAIAMNDSGTDTENSDAKSDNGINKVLNMVKDLKSEAGIGNLREAKNEILALNFKKDDNGSK